MKVDVSRRGFAVPILLLLAACGNSHTDTDNRYWHMHVIDDSYSGADGVDLVDIDADGDLDAVVAWEEAGAVLLHENPGPPLAGAHWPHTSIDGGLAVGKVEDAKVADFDADGIVDAVVSANEKGSERIGLHWLYEQQQPHSEQSWRGGWPDQSLQYKYIKVSIGQIDGRGGRDIVAGSKAEGKPGGLVWYQAPQAPGPGNIDQWRSYLIDQIDWVDSVEITDINDDGRNDILLNYWGNLLWYENLGAGSATAGAALPGWQKHQISNTTKSYFADCSGDDGPIRGRLMAVGADLSSAGAGDVVVYLVGKTYHADGRWDGGWTQREVRSHEPVPREAGLDDYAIKRIACGNIDDDAKLDIVVAMSGRGHGVFALMNLENTLADQSLHLQVIAGDEYHSRKGVKHDNLVLEDLDQDGDLDIITTEENGSRSLINRFVPGFSTRGLGLIWYENPG